jgi:GntR family transcriptional regulator/MocR family aminotransferase
MIPVLDRKAKHPIFGQLYEYFREAILREQLRQDEALPSIRLLAQQLAVGKNTIIKAYEQLVAEGYLYNKPRQGYFVEHVAGWTSQPNNETAEWPKSTAARAGNFHLPPVRFNVCPWVIDTEHFPVRDWKRAESLSMNKLLYQYDCPDEQVGLKEQLLRYLYQSRGVHARPEQVVFCAGSNIVYLLLSVLLQGHSKHLLFEEPGYYNARNIFALAGYPIEPMPVSRERGIDAGVLASTEANLLYLTPSHQYPTGAVLSIQQRQAVLAWATDRDAYLIEDDYDSEFRYTGQPLPSLQSLDRRGRVIYTGTFSSTLMPSLRLAYLVLPEPLLSHYEGVRYLSNTVPVTTQKALALFMERGYWEKHLRRMRKVYRRKYQQACQAVQQELGPFGVSFHPTRAGLSLMLTVENGQTEEQLLAAARREGLLMEGISRCYLNGVARGAAPQLFFGFGNLSPADLQTCVRLLKTAWCADVKANGTGQAVASQPAGAVARVLL